MSSLTSAARAAASTGHNYPRNCWWVAARQDEVTTRPIARWLLDSPVVLYRGESGQTFALEDRCLHRWAPLSTGEISGNDIVCGYHGAVFGPSGQCLSYPTQDRVPAAARLKSYPVLEKPPFIWIWMGEPSRCTDAPEPPAFEWADDPQWLVTQDRVEIDANYFLLHENVLDLTHLNFIHRASLAMIDQPASKFERKGRQVISHLVHEPYQAPVWQSEMNSAHRLRRETHAAFVSPALHVARILTTDLEADGQERENFLFYAIHCVTPVTPNKMLYWYIFGQDFGQGPGAEQALRGVINKAAEEDKAILESVQRVIDRDPRGRDAPEFSFSGDSGGILARRLLQELLEEEQSTASAASA